MMITLISHSIIFSIISFHKNFCHTNKFNARDITWGQLDATLVRCEPSARDTRFQLAATR